MSLHEKALDPLLELGNLAMRRTRAEQIDQALRTALLITEADAAMALSPYARRGERLVLHAGSVTPAILPSHGPGSEVVRFFAEDCRPLVVQDLIEEARWSSNDGCPGVEAGPALYTPLRQRDTAPGYIAVFRRHARPRFALADNCLMLLLSDWLGLALENLRLSSGMAKLSVTDGLTEVYNARFLRTALRRELRRTGRLGQEVSLVLVEPDQLEILQAEHGELRAGLILREFASLLAQHVRAYDLVARADGEGFMLILPETAKNGATEVAERMRAAVEANEFSSGPAGTITACFGVASFPRDGADEKSLVASVKRALGEARKRGTNTVHSLENDPSIGVVSINPIQMRTTGNQPRRNVKADVAQPGSN